MAVAQETLDQLRSAGLADVDPDIAVLLGRELDRQRNQIELIASENFTWPSRTAMAGSTSARPAVRSWSSVSWATAMPFLLTAGTTRC